MNELDIWMNAYLNSYKRGASNRELDVINSRINLIIDTKGIEYDCSL